MARLAVLLRWLTYSCLVVNSSSLMTRPFQATEWSDDIPNISVYVYEGKGVEWIKNCNLTRMLENRHVLMPDVALHRKLAQHPWRVAEPKDADLFFVPAYLTMSQRGLCGSNAANMKATAAMLSESPFFDRYHGADHIIAGFGWEVTPARLAVLGPLTEKMIVAHFESARPPKYKHHDKNASTFKRMFAVPYGTVTSSLKDTTELRRLQGETFAERNLSLFFMGQADDRPSYKERRLALRTLPASFPDSMIVQTGAEAWQQNNPSLHKKVKYSNDDPAKLHTLLSECSVSNHFSGCRSDRDDRRYLQFGAQAKYWLVMHGDTPSTSRLYDSVLLGAVPIIISAGFKETAMPYPEDFPWTTLAAFIEQDAFDLDPIGEVKSALARAEHGSFQNFIDLGRAALDWTATGDCQGTMILTHVARNFLHRTLPQAAQHSLCRKYMEPKYVESPAAPSDDMEPKYVESPAAPSDDMEPRYVPSFVPSNDMELAAPAAGSSHVLAKLDTEAVVSDTPVHRLTQAPPPPAHSVLASAENGSFQTFIDVGCAALDWTVNYLSSVR